MNALDVLILIPALWAGFRGFKNGLVRELFSLLAFIAGIWCVRYTPLIADKWDFPAASVVAFALIFIVAIAATVLVGRFVEKVVKIVVPDLVNRLCGIAFGVLKVMMICSVILYFVKAVDTKEIILTSNAVQNSVLYEYVEKSTEFLIQYANLNP